MIEHAYLELFKDSSAHKELDIAYGEDKHITNSKIRQESMKIIEGIANSNELKFGTLVSSSFDIQLAIDTDNLTNADIEVSVAVNHDTENVLKIGKYKVISDKPTADRLYKNIKAYDGLYEVINADVSDWYESLTFPMTLKAFRDSFFAEVGIEQVEATLVNDDMNIEKTISTNSLSGRQVLSAICELNGAFGRMNREGKFAYIFLEVNPTDRIEISNYASGTGGYEDFETTPIGKVQIRQETNDIGATVGEGTNGYVVQDNFLVYGKSTEDLTTIATNLLSIIEGITYRPYTGIKTLGNPCYEVGDAVTIPTRNATINSYILNRTLTGIQALRDTYKAEGVEVYTQKVNSFDNEVKQLKRQTNELSRTVEETKSTITSIETIAGNASDLAEKANQTATSANTTANNANNLANQANTKAEDIADDLAKNYSTTTQMNSAIQQSAEGITQTVSKTYTTKSEAVTSSRVYYALSSSNTLAPTSGWNVGAPEWTADKYMWQKTVVTYADGTTTESNPTCIQGAKGQDGQDGTNGKDGTSITIKSTSITYQASSSGTTTPTGNWSTSVPNVSNGQYLWTKTVVTYSDNTSTTAYSVAYKGTNGTNGKDGANGTDGKDGTNGQDGTSFYTHIRYSANANGSNFVSSPTSATTYIGVYTGTSSTAPTSPSSYTWSKFMGDKGATGNGINSITYYYATTTTQTAPSASSITSTSIPALSVTNKYLWQKEVIDYTDSSVADKTSVILLAVYGDTGATGATGKGIKSIVPQYYLSTSNTTQTGGSWSTTVPTWVSGKYIWTRNYITWSDNTTSTTTAVLDNSLNGLGDRVTKAEASIKTNADNIALKVSKTDYTGEQITSLINQTAESIKILAQHLKLEGLTTINDNFQVLEDGSVLIKGGSVHIDTDDADYSNIKLAYGNENGSMSTQLSPNFLQINAESSTYNYKRAATYSVNGLIATDYLSDTEQMTANYSNNNYGMYKQTQTDAGPIATYYHRLNQNEAYHGVPLTAKSVKTAAGADLDTLNSNLANLSDRNELYVKPVYTGESNYAVITITGTLDSTGRFILVTTTSGVICVSVNINGIVSTTSEQVTFDKNTKKLTVYVGNWFQTPIVISTIAIG